MQAIKTNFCPNHMYIIRISMLCCVTFIPRGYNRLLSLSYDYQSLQFRFCGRGTCACKHRHTHVYTVVYKNVHHLWATCLVIYYEMIYFRHPVSLVMLFTNIIYVFFSFSLGAQGYILLKGLLVVVNPYYFQEFLHTLP